MEIFHHSRPHRLLSNGYMRLFSWGKGGGSKIWQVPSM